jgi:uncharacterized RDD family membrane protein YckC
LPWRRNGDKMVFGLQKASVSKRISAYMLDFIVFAIIAVGLALIISTVVGYDGYVNKFNDFSVQYEERYGITTNITQEDYDKLSESDKAKYDAAEDAFSKDPEVVKVFSILMNLSMIIVSMSLLIAFVLTEIVVPILFKNGQTLGKKIFGIAVMRVDGVRITTFQLFARTILGKYTIETMIPVLLIIMMFFGVMSGIAPIVIGLLALLQIIIIIATKTNSAIHDLFACTVVVDMATQMIFDSEESMIKYKKQLAEKKANEQSYF